MYQPERGCSSSELSKEPPEDSANIILVILRSVSQAVPQLNPRSAAALMLMRSLAPMIDIDAKFLNADKTTFCAAFWLGLFGSIAARLTEITLRR